MTKETLQTGLASDSVKTNLLVSVLFVVLDSLALHVLSRVWQYHTCGEMMLGARVSAGSTHVKRD